MVVRMTLTIRADPSCQCRRCPCQQSAGINVRRGLNIICLCIDCFIEQLDGIPAHTWRPR